MGSSPSQGYFCKSIYVLYDASSCQKVGELTFSSNYRVIFGALNSQWQCRYMFRDREDELDAYLAAPTEATTNPLKWWWEKRYQYPTLSQMALDYLSVPGTILFCLSFSATYLYLDSYIDRSRACIFKGPPTPSFHSQPPFCKFSAHFPLPRIMEQARLGW